MSHVVPDGLGLVPVQMLASGVQKALAVPAWAEGKWQA